MRRQKRVVACLRVIGFTVAASNHKMIIVMVDIGAFTMLAMPLKFSYNTRLSMKQLSILEARQ